MVNPINLNGGVRTVQVNDNTTTTTDFATMSGVLSGGTGSGLIKTGAGTLILGNSNTYSGNTSLSVGAVGRQFHWRRFRNFQQPRRWFGHPEFGERDECARPSLHWFG